MGVGDIRAETGDGKVVMLDLKTMSDEYNEAAPAQIDPIEAELLEAYIEAGHGDYGEGEDDDDPRGGKEEDPMAGKKAYKSAATHRYNRYNAPAWGRSIGL